MSVAFVERTHRLALGIEPRDALHRQRLPHAVRIDVEGDLPWTPQLTENIGRTWLRPMAPEARRPVVTRHDSCRHVLLYPPPPVDGKPAPEPAPGATIDLRIYEHHRRYVPRRFRVPLLSLATILQAEQNGSSVPVASRSREPWLFPGAAFDSGYLATGLRGRVLRNGEPLRWARIEARLPSENPNANPLVVGRAQGDDRGEFLLLLEPAAGATELDSPINVNVVVFGPQAVPVPASSKLPDDDVWWDLPLEQLPAIGNNDTVSTGVQNPADYVAGSTQPVAFQIGRIISAANGVNDFHFVAP